MWKRNVSVKEEVNWQGGGCHHRTFTFPTGQRALGSWELQQSSASDTVCPFAIFVVFEVMVDRI